MKTALRNVLIFLLIFIVWGSYRIHKDFSADPSNTQEQFYNTAYGMSKTNKEVLDLSAFTVPVLVGVFVASLGKYGSNSQRLASIYYALALFLVSVFSFYFLGWLVPIITSESFTYAYNTNYQDVNPIGIFIFSFYASIIFLIISSNFFTNLFRKNRSI